MTLQSTALEWEKKSKVARLVALAMLATLVAYPTVVQGQPTSGSPTAAASHSISREFCEEPQLMDFTSLGAQARAALGRCESPANEHEGAACRVLRGRSLLTSGDMEAALEELRQALAIYERVKDSWGGWIVHVLMGASLDAEGDLAESHYRKGLMLLAPLESSEEPDVSARSLRLFGEIFQVPEVVLSIMEVRPDSIMSAIVQFAATTTHYLLAANLGCRKRHEEAERHARQALANVRANASIFDESLLSRQLGWLQEQREYFDGSSQQPLEQAVPVERQPGSGGFIVDHLYTSMYHEFCEEPQLIDFDSPISSQVRASLAQCGPPADEHERAACTLLRGFELMINDHREAALGAFDEALSMYARSRDLWGTWMVHLLQAISAQAAGQSQLAETCLNRAFESLKLLESTPQPIPIRSLQLFGEIAGADNLSLKLFKSMPDLLTPRLMQAAARHTHYLLGMAQACQRRLEEAEEHLRQASKIRFELELVDETPLHGLLGLIHQQRGQLDAALISFQKILQAAHSQEDSALVLNVAEQLSQISSTGGSIEESLGINQKALEIGGSDPSMQALLLVERGVLYVRAGRMAEARRTLAAARAVAELAAEAALLEREVLLVAGIRLAELGFFEDAASSLEEVVQQLNSQDLGENDLWILESAHFYLVVAYHGLGLGSLLKTEVEELRRFVENSGHQELLRVAELALADPSENAPEIWLNAWRQLVKTAKSSKDPAWRWAAREFQAMQEFLERASQTEDGQFWRAFFGQADASTGVNRGLAPLAPAFEHLQHGRKDEAFRVFGKTIQQYLDSSRPSRLEEAKALMALALVPDAPLETSIAKCKRSIELFESFVDEMRVEETITALIEEDGHQLYRLAVQLLAPVSPEEAFSYAERGRAWTLRRLLADIRRNVVEPGSMEQEVLAKLSALERDGRIASGQEKVRIRELDKLREEYEKLRLRHRLTATKEAALHSVEPLSFERLQHEVLTPDTTLLTYFFGTEQLWLWAVDHNGIEMTSIGIPKGQTLNPGPEKRWKDLTCQIQALRWQGSPPQARRAAEARGARLLSDCDDKTDPASTLYRQLIAPIAPHLRHPHLIVVPHGILHHLPFAALRNPETGRYLVEDFTLSLAPSVSALGLLSRRAKAVEGEALVLGNPLTSLEPLAGAQVEAKTVAGLLGSTPFVGDSATESRVYEKAGRISVLHLAAHGQYVPRNPYFSRVLLTADSENNGALEMHEVLDRLDLRGTELVVLSGCETALGEITRGDEIIGLTRAFLVAGSQTVISTLWPINDEASERLMTAFYEHFLEKGATAADALRAAQLETLEQEDTAAPYFWAGFTLTGDPYNRWHPTRAESVETSLH